MLKYNLKSCKIVQNQGDFLMNKWKKLAIAGVTLATVTFLAACGNNSSKSASDTSTINWYTPTEILTLDISKNTDRYSAMAIGNAGSNLLRVDENGENKPDLAEKVEVSEDGKTFTATLRDGIKWSDGSDITA